LLDDDQYQWIITELEVDASVILFFAESSEWELDLDELAGFSTEDIVYITGGVVYTLIVEIPSS